MIIVKNRVAGLILVGHFHAICIWPFLFIKPGTHNSSYTETLNHERIHARQQLEMVWILFFVWYGIEYLIRLVFLRNRLHAYRELSHEKEAFSNERDPDYLKKRKMYAWLKYL